MDWEELFAEDYRPSPSGWVEFRAPHVRRRSMVAIFIRILLAGALLTGGVILYLKYAAPLHGQGPRIAQMVALFYVLSGFFVHADADLSDLGWLGGLINRPGRSDDFNRSMLAVKILLYPASFVTSVVFETILMVFKGQPNSP